MRLKWEPFFLISQKFFDEFIFKVNDGISDKLQSVLSDFVKDRKQRNTLN